MAMIGWNGLVSLSLCPVDVSPAAFHKVFALMQRNNTKQRDIRLDRLDVEAALVLAEVDTE